MWYEMIKLAVIDGNCQPNQKLKNENQKFVTDLFSKTTHIMTKMVTNIQQSGWNWLFYDKWSIYTTWHEKTCVSLMKRVRNQAQSY